jgi:uncharacterized Ntn-hydrolase superfamily protein
MELNTFSVVAHDERTGELGVAVASHYFAVGSVVQWAEAGVGVIATQANVNVSFGALGLDWLRKGLDAEGALNKILEGDTSDDRRGRQVAIVDSKGNIANFTGPVAPNWAGAKKGKTWSVQGNLLSGPQVIDAMSEALESGGQELAERLYAALKAGDDAGGDSRGRQSAAMLIVGKGLGRNFGNDRPVSIHVDDHENPLVELRRLLSLNLAYLYIDRAYKAMTASDNAAALLAKQKASAYAATSDTQLRMGFLEYFLGDRNEALSLFEKVRNATPNFRALWRGTVLGRPAFSPILNDLDFLQKLFPAT